MDRRNEISTYLENIALLIMGVTLLAFPLIFTPATTDPFAIPKQGLLAAGVLIALVLLAAKIVAEGSVRLRRTPFDIPIILFLGLVVISSASSFNQADALISVTPLVFSAIFYFVIVQLAKTKQAIFFLLSCLVVGTSFSALISFLSFFKLYIIPMDVVKVPQFSTFGSLLDQGVYFAIVLPIAIYLGWPIIQYLLTREENQHKNRSSVLHFSADSQNLATALLFAFCTLLIGASLVTTLIHLTNPSYRPPILPWDVGFQTSFAAISQDTARQFGVFQGFLFGSGFGTYATDFTRFKPVSFNLDQTLWTLTFLRSSNYFFDLLATTGLLGLLSFLFIVLRSIRQLSKSRPSINPLYFALVLVLLSLLLPTSFVIQSLFLIVLGLFSTIKLLEDAAGYFEVELYFGASKRSGIMSSLPFVPSVVELENGEMPTRHPKVDQSFSRILPIIFAGVYVLFCIAAGWITFRYIASDTIFQTSRVAASQNNALATYNNQVQAINLFDRRDLYPRTFSQVNLAIANSIAGSLPRNATPSAQTQQTITGLIQQSINSARSASALSPLTAANWTNLGTIYGSLIGFGQNAEQFAITADQQAIVLDPNNPQLYINLGGLYYQLGLWDDAIRQFQLAVNLKPDLANAYYNLGHAYEQKGDYPTALAQYQSVKQLVANEPDSVKKIDSEIKALETKSGQMAKQQAQSQTPPPSSEKQPPLGVNASPTGTQLPEDQKVKLPEPPKAIAPSTTPAPSVSATPTPKK